MEQLLGLFSGQYFLGSSGVDNALLESIERHVREEDTLRLLRLPSLSMALAARNSDLIAYLSGSRALTDLMHIIFRPESLVQAEGVEAVSPEPEDATLALELIRIAERYPQLVLSLIMAGGVLRIPFRAAAQALDLTPYDGPIPPVEARISALTAFEKIISFCLSSSEAFPAFLEQLGAPLDVAGGPTLEDIWVTLLKRQGGGGAFLALFSDEYAESEDACEAVERFLERTGIVSALVDSLIAQQVSRPGETILTLINIAKTPWAHCIVKRIDSLGQFYFDLIESGNPVTNISVLNDLFIGLLNILLSAGDLAAKACVEANASSNGPLSVDLLTQHGFQYAREWNYVCESLVPKLCQSCRIVGDRYSFCQVMMLQLLTCFLELGGRLANKTGDLIEEKEDVAGMVLTRTVLSTNARVLGYSVSPSIYRASACYGPAGVLSAVSVEALFDLYVHEGLFATLVPLMRSLPMCDKIHFLATRLFAIASFHLHTGIPVAADKAFETSNIVAAVETLSKFETFTPYKERLSCDVYLMNLLRIWIRIVAGVNSNDYVRQENRRNLSPGAPEDAFKYPMSIDALRSHGGESALRNAIMTPVLEEVSKRFLSHDTAGTHIYDMQMQPFASRILDAKLNDLDPEVRERLEGYVKQEPTFATGGPIPEPPLAQQMRLLKQFLSIMSVKNEDDSPGRESSGI